MPTKIIALLPTPNKSKILTINKKCDFPFRIIALFYCLNFQFRQRIYRGFFQAIYRARVLLGLR